LLAMDTTTEPKDGEVWIPFTKASWWSQFPAGAIKAAVGCAVGTILVFIFWLAIKVFSRLLLRFLRKTDLPRDMEDMMIIALRISIWIQVIPIVVAQTGLPMDSTITVVGAVVVGLGMALRPTVENFVSGVVLRWQDGFDLGSVVCLGGSIKGVVTQIRMTFVTLEQSDGETVFIPNNKVYSNAIRNFSKRGQMRLDVDFPLAVTTSSAELRKARKVMLQALKDVDRVLPDPAPKVVIEDISEYKVVVSARPWVLPEHYLSSRPIVNEVLREALLENGIKLANRTLQIPGEEDREGLDDVHEDDQQGDIEDHIAIVAAAATSL